MITFNGDECNKIGVGYTAFRTQGDRCGQVLGSCLGNQISDLIDEDISRLASGLEPKYLLDSSFIFTNSTGEKLLRFKYDHLQTTLLTLEIKADDSRYFYNVARGLLLTAEVQEFEAMSINGKLKVSMMNLEGFPGSFFLTVQNCTGGVVDIPARQVSLEGNGFEIFEFDILTTDSEGGSHECQVVLQNSEGDQIDQLGVGFTTTEQIEIAVDQGDAAGGGEGASEQINGVENCDTCSAYFDFMCKFKLECIWEQIQIFIIIGGVVAVGIVAFVVFVITLIYCPGLYACCLKVCLCLPFKLLSGMS